MRMGTRSVEPAPAGRAAGAVRATAAAATSAQARARRQRRSLTEPSLRRRSAAVPRRSWSSPPAAADPRVLMPGVTYERTVEFTPHGAAAAHVVTAPRPSGLYALRPVLSNDLVSGRE